MCAQPKDMRHIGALRQRLSIDGRIFTKRSKKATTVQPTETQDVATAAGDGQRGAGQRRPTLRPSPSEDEENDGADGDEVYFTFAPGAVDAARRKSETDVVNRDNQNA